MKEVYIAYGKEGDVLYVGQGNLGRHNHCLNGTSHNQSLNRYFFCNGEGDCISVKVNGFFETAQEALNMEKYLIQTLKPKFNCEIERNSLQNMTQLKKLESGRRTNFRQLAENYYEAKIRLKGCEDSSIHYTIEDIDCFLSTIKKTETLCKGIVEYVNVLGLDALKSCGFQESRIRRKYEVRVGVTKLETSPRCIQKCLRLIPDTFVSLRVTKVLLQEAYDKLGIKEVAKANHLENYYPVKRCKRDGVIGYLIIDDKQSKEI